MLFYFRDLKQLSLHFEHHQRCVPTYFSQLFACSPGMAANNILNVFPVEILEHVLSLLSDSRSDISSCRLTCRAFYWISSPYLLPSVVLADNLGVLHKAHQIIQHQFFRRHVKELIYVPDHYDDDDDDKYETTLEEMDWEHMIDQDKLLWQDLARYSEYRGQGPENLQSGKSIFKSRYFSPPDFRDYSRAIRMNLLEELLKTLPNLHNIVLTDFSSVRRGGLIGSTRKMDPHEQTNLFTNSAYGDDEISVLIYCVSRLRRRKIKSITFGPWLFENSEVFWEERRDEIGLAGRERLSYHLDLTDIDELWKADHDEVKDIMRGLRRLHLPFQLYEYDEVTSLTTSLPSIVEVAAPSLTHLNLDAKGLIRDGTPRDNLGLLNFEAFFGKLHMPRLIQIDLLGWVYTQAQVQDLLLRHAETLRKLRLMHNVMLEGDDVALADFGRDRLLLVGIELDWEPDLRESSEEILDESSSDLLTREHRLVPRRRNPNFTLEFRWLCGRSNQIVRTRKWRCDQYMASSALE